MDLVKIEQLKKLAAALKDKHSASTPGPWARGAARTRDHASHIHDAAGRPLVDVVKTDRAGEPATNEDFIVHAHANAATLADLVAEIVAAHEVLLMSQGLADGAKEKKLAAPR